MNTTRLLLTLIGTSLVASMSWAQTVAVTDVWARATVPGQRATGAFMKITAKDGARLVGATSPVAGVTEIHEMKMDKDVMKMAAIAALDLPAGKTVELRPGGYHVMLMDLKQALPKDSTVPLTLQFVDAKGKPSQMEIKVPVSTLAPGGAMPGGMSSEHKHGDHKH